MGDRGLTLAAACRIHGGLYQECERGMHHGTINGRRWTYGLSKSILIRQPELSALLVLGLAALVTAWRRVCFISRAEAAGSATPSLADFADKGVWLL